MFSSFSYPIRMAAALFSIAGVLGAAASVAPAAAQGAPALTAQAPAAVAYLGEPIVDDRGRALRIDRPPSRIISLLPSVTETICEIGGCAKLVGTDRYSNWPQSVAALPKLGGIEDAGIERLVSLHPDLVLTSLSSRLNDRLDELGIPVVALQPKTLADVHRVLTLIARILGAPEAGERVWRLTEARISAAAARMPVAWRGRRAYFEVSEAPHAASASSFLGELLSQLGLANAVPGDLGPFPQLNPEFIVRAQPDLILASASELSAMPSRPGWSTLRALRTGRGCGFSPAEIDVLVRPGPRLGEAAEEIVDCVSHLPVPDVLHHEPDRAAVSLRTTE